MPIPLKHSIDYWKENKRFPTKENRIKLQDINNLDFRGISDAELFFFSSFIGSKNRSIDFSFGKGAINLNNSQLDTSDFQEFNFDRSTSLIKSIIAKCSFVKSKLIFNATDVIFEDCNFSQTTFKGGFHEYGFRRCKFINYNFNGAHWQNTYFFASWFTTCSFIDFKISKSLIRGFKVDDLTSSVKSIFVDCKVDGLLENTFSR